MPHTSLILSRPGDEPRQLVLLFHGLGADAEDLRPVGERMAAEYPQALVVSVRAPHATRSGGGYQWLPPDDLDDARRAEHVAAELPAFAATIRHWQREAGLDAEATVLIGFAQGATMVLEATAQAGAVPLAGRAVALAGRYARLPAANPAATTLFLLHGAADTVIPTRCTEDAASHLVALGADVVADVIPQLGHGIDATVLDLLVRRLRTHVPRRHWEAALRQGVPPTGGGTQ